MVTGSVYATVCVSRPRDIIGGAKICIVSGDPDHATFKGGLPFLVLGLEISYLCTTFDHSISRSRDMVGTHVSFRGDLSSAG